MTWHDEQQSAFGSMKTVQLTKTSRKVWLLLILLILPYLFAPLRIILYWLCWHWQQSWNFFLCISDEKVGYDSSHWIWVKAIPYKKPNSFDAFPSEEKRLENTQKMRQSCLILLFNAFHSQIENLSFCPTGNNSFWVNDTKILPKATSKRQTTLSKKHSIRQMPSEEITNATLCPTSVEQWLLEWKVTDYYGELSIFLIALNYLNAEVC